ncbi:MFS transporter [Amycolatopsis minnesotensis]|uniref:MFS transporter n=1 Tax=Amycolatopsis minnesotensis TaxID=337894 RepID=A0ABN2QN22_9PSEU
MITGTGRKWWVLTGVGILSFLGCIDLTIVNTAAPEISRELGATMVQTQLVVNVFVVALSMFMVTAGRLSDLLGRRRVLYTGAILFGLFSLGAGLVTDVPALIAFRFLQGAACAVLYTGTSTIVAEAFPESRRGRAIGSLFAINGIGLAIGPMLGGLLVGVLGWHWVFLVNVPLVLVALLICAVSVHESRGADGTGVDWPGLALLAIGLAGVLFAVTFGDTFGWGSWPVLGALAAGSLALAAFVLVDRGAAHPLVPFPLLANRRFLSAVVAEFSLAFFYTTALFLMPLYLSVVRRFDEVVIGLLMLPTTVVVALLSPVLGRVVDRVGACVVMMTGFGAFAGSALLQSRLDSGTGLGYVVAAFVLMGIGWAAVLGPSAVTALSAVPPESAGLAVGATWTFHNLGGGIGLAVGMTLFRAFAGDGAVRADTFPAGNRAAMLLLAGTSLAALAGIAVLGRRTWRKPGNQR